MTRIQKRKVTREVFQQRHDAVADFVEQGNTLRQAMLKAGYSEARADRGIAGVPKVVIEKLARRGLHFTSLAKTYGDEDKGRAYMGLTNLSRALTQSGRTAGRRHRLRRAGQ